MTMPPIPTSRRETVIDLLRPGYLLLVGGRRHGTWYRLPDDVDPDPDDVRLPAPLHLRDVLYQGDNPAALLSALPVYDVYERTYMRMRSPGQPAIVTIVYVRQALPYREAATAAAYHVATCPGVQCDSPTSHAYRDPYL